MAKLKLALLVGGLGGEREVSLKTGEQILNALDKNKYKIIKYDPKTDLEKFISDGTNKKFDLILPALHGPFGEDGKIQGLFELMEIPYVFSGVLASAIAMHKQKAKLAASAAGVDIIPDMVIEQDDDYDETEVLKFIMDEFKLPLVIKPIELGSSVGMSIPKNEGELKKGLRAAFKYDNTLILEEFIQGRELTVSIIGQGSKAKALPVIEIKPKVSEWFDYKAKYEQGGSEEICPADIPDAARDEVKNSALEVFKAIGCKDLARADFIWQEKENKFYFIDINTIPGMTATSLAPQAAKAAGMEFGAFLDKLISYNINKNSALL